MTEPHPAKLVQEIIDSLNKASGCCSQLIHSHGSPAFIIIRQSLDLTKEGLTMSALREYEKPVFIRPL